MDTSEVYIKMCDCPEIQEQSTCQAGYADLMKVWGYHEIDIDGYRKGNLVVDHYGNVFIRGWWKGKSSHLWLPTQTQIQEMLLEDIDLKWNIPKLFGNFQGFFGSNKNYERFHSFEQLWIAFYMHEKYQKTWDGKTWIKT